MEFVTVPQSKAFSLVHFPQLATSDECVDIKFKPGRVFDTHSVQLVGKELKIQFTNPILKSGAYVVDTGLLMDEVGDYVVVLEQHDGPFALPHTPDATLKAFLYLDVGSCVDAVRIRVFKTQKKGCEVSNSDEIVQITSDSKLMFSEFGYMYEMADNAKSVYYLFAGDFDEEIRPSDTIVNVVKWEVLSRISLD